MQPAVRVENLRKTYRLYPASVERALDAFRRKRTGRTFTALKDVTAEFPTGEVIAVLGKNGSGKSTLLKIIAGVTTPTAGSVEVNGRVSAMLELTAGFDPELTGIENIRLKALSMGILRREIEAKMDEIIAFADIGEHIDQPVRTYSSGMKSRLGFAVAVSVDPDILIVDEVLAVGDDIFRVKCIDKMEQFRQQGKTIIFVSHSLFTVKAFCTKAIWLNEGEIKAAGELGEVVVQYEDFLRAEKARQAKKDKAADKPETFRKQDIVGTHGFRMFNSAGETTRDFSVGEEIWFEFGYTVKRPTERLTFCITLRNAEMLEIFMGDKQAERNELDASVGEHSVRVKMPGPNLLAGTYHLSGELWNNDSGFYVSYANRQPFRLTQDEFVGTGITRIDYELAND
jgi:teichoic acid transport system ATP-binding protein